MIEQGTEEWFNARLGKVTASRVKDVMSKGRGGKPSATRRNYMMQLLCERLTGTREDGFTSAAMQRGTDLEPLARSAYEMANDVIVLEAPFTLHPKWDGLGASPDGLVGKFGLIEIKCPNTAQHVAVLQSEQYDDKYFWQMQTQMACTGREWCDFVSFDDRMPEALQIVIVRLNRDEQAISDLITETLEFLGELETLEKQMKTKMEKSI